VRWFAARWFNRFSLASRVVTTSFEVRPDGGRKLVCQGLHRITVGVSVENVAEDVGQLGAAELHG